jgi:hypothetical protein
MSIKDLRAYTKRIDTNAQVYFNQWQEAESQLKEEREENTEAIRCLKNALEYYHNDKFANRAKSMKSLIEDALDILTSNPK